MTQEFTSIFHDLVIESGGTTPLDKFNNKFIKGNGIKPTVNLSGIKIGKDDTRQSNNNPNNRPNNSSLPSSTNKDNKPSNSQSSQNNKEDDE